VEHFDARQNRIREESCGETAILLVPAPLERRLPLVRVASSFARPSQPGFFVTPDLRPTALERPAGWWSSARFGVTPRKRLRHPVGCFGPLSSGTSRESIFAQARRAVLKPQNVSLSLSAQKNTPHGDYGVSSLSSPSDRGFPRQVRRRSIAKTLLQLLRTATITSRARESCPGF
jgi:hypothetical protein